MDDAQWYYGEDGEQRGPVTLDALRERIARGALRGDDLVWRAGMPEWIAATSVPELADVFARPAPPSVVPGPPPFVHGAPVSQAAMPRPLPAPQAYATPTMDYATYDPALVALRSRANTSLVLGILSIAIGPCCCSPIGLVLAVFAIVLARKASLAPNAGTATAGLICGIVGLVLNLGACGINGTSVFMNGSRNFNWSQLTSTPTITPVPTMPVLPTTNP